MKSSFTFQLLWPMCAALLLLGCPVEPIPARGFCGELCQELADNPSEDMSIADMDASDSPPDMPLNQGEVLCRLGVGTEDLLIDVLGVGVVSYEIKDGFLNVVAQNLASISVIVSGPDERPYAQWSESFTVDAQCSEFLVDGAPLYLWGGVGVPLSMEPLASDIAQDTRVELDVERGVMAVQVGSSPWQLVSSSSTARARLQIGQTEALENLGSAATLMLSPDGQSLVAFGAGQVVLMTDIGARQPQVTQQTSLSDLVHTWWDSSKNLLYALSVGTQELYVIDPVQGLTIPYESGLSGFLGYDVMDGHVWAVLTGGNVRHYDPDRNRLSATRGPGDVSALRVSQDQASLLLLSGESECASRGKLGEPCVATLVDSSTLAPLMDANGAPVVVTNIIAAITTSFGFALVEQNDQDVRVSLLKITDDSVAYEDVGPSVLPLPEFRKEHSVILDGGVFLSGENALVMVDLEQEDVNTLSGAWQFASRTHTTVEFIAESGAWFGADRIVYNHDLSQRYRSQDAVIGSGFNTLISYDGQSSVSVDGMQGAYLLGSTPDLSLIPTPSGAPCMLYEHTTLSAGESEPVKGFVTCGVGVFE